MSCDDPQCVNGRHRGLTPESSLGAKDGKYYDVPCPQRRVRTVSKPNNYIRNRVGNFHFFDDRDPVAVQEANEAARQMPRPRGQKECVAWRAAPGLVVDGYVGVMSSKSNGLLS